jgi:NAD(P)-dependent dehydrogenase (short-subunit alcohol dehydrogenase family)
MTTNTIQNRPQVALVTGASSGIGKATALQLQQAGFITYASARRPDQLSELVAAGCRPLPLDVTNEASMIAAVERIVREHGAVDLLVNNAGYGEMGPIEEVTLDGWRKQFETNVFGLVRLTQLVLPGMRAQGRGRIINIGSGGGEFTFPLGGAYHASKYALEAISDALRFEVAPFGIAVVLIQPSPVRTPLAAATVEAIRTTPTSPYAPLVSAFRRLSEASAASGQGYISAEAVAKTIVEAAQSPRPKTRYMLGSVARFMSTLRHLLPDRWWDGLLRRMYGTTNAQTEQTQTRPL